MLDILEPQDFATDELDQREAEQPAPLPPDDDEVMTNNLPMIYTSTERINQLEAEHKRTRDLVRVCLRRITDVSLSVDDLKPVVAGLEATVTRWTGGQ